VDVDGLAEGAIVGRLLARSIVRPAFQRFLVDVDHIAALLGVVGQGFPWNRIVVRAQSQHAAEGKHGVLDLAGLLVDHQIVDGSELFTCPVEDSGAFDLV
jgi:hypothetical protein